MNSDKLHGKTFLGFFSYITSNVITCVMCIMGADRNMCSVSVWQLLDLDKDCSKGQGQTSLRQCKA